MSRMKQTEISSRNRSAGGKGSVMSVSSRLSGREERSKKIAAASASSSSLAAERNTKTREESRPAASPSQRKAIDLNTLQDPDRFTCDSILRRAGLDIDIDSISDELLRETIVEHSSLQETRLSLLNRIDTARRKSKETEAKAQEVERSVTELIMTVREEMSKPSPDWNLHVKKQGGKVENLAADIERVRDQKQLAALIGEWSANIYEMGACSVSKCIVVAWI